MMMACSLRLPCFSTQHPHKTLFKPFKKLPSFINNTNTTFTLYQTPPNFDPIIIKPKRCNNFTLHFSTSSTTQDPVLQNPQRQQQGEEFDKKRVLASNIPWDSTPEDIRALFEKFGTVVDVELSMYNKTRNRGLAFVTMGSEEEALAALKNLESYEFEGRTLRMNYAKAKQSKSTTPVPPKPAPQFNLFVANLAFQARAKDLKEFFVSQGSNVLSAEIIFHDNPNRRSSGYGFVGFRTKQEADEALSSFQGKEFMGRPLRVARSRQFVKQRKDASDRIEL